MSEPRLPALPLMKRLLIVAALVATAGCSKSTQPVDYPPPNTMPLANSPQELMDAFIWCNQNLSIEDYRTLFTDDFKFAFAAFDTNGSSYRDDPWTREDELAYFEHLVTGDTLDMPAAHDLYLEFRDVNVQEDPRPGKASEQRRMVNTTVSLIVQTIDGRAISITGRATFYVVRGDSAQIPTDLDPDRYPGTWYIERWEDQTYSPYGGAGPAPHRSQPSQSYTWGSLKTRYR